MSNRFDYNIKCEQNITQLENSTYKDYKVQNYQCHKSIKAKMIA